MLKEFDRAIFECQANISSEELRSNNLTLYAKVIVPANTSYYGNTVAWVTLYFKAVPFMYFM